MLPRVSLVECEKAKYLIFSTDDFISQHLFNHGSWEKHLLDISKMFYSAVEYPLVLDIGANLGAYSIPIAKDIQSVNGQVIAFEPQRIIFYQLCGNAFINRLDNYYPINKAVSDSPGTADIPEFNFEKNNNIGAFSLEKDFRVAQGIETSRLDRYCKVDTINLDTFEVERPPALIKIDVEGFEINVLRGSFSFLKRHNYPPILFEVWDFEWFSDRKKELISLVESLGYTLFKVDPTNFIAQHPKNSVAIEFKLEKNIIHMGRVK
jgi:FkbM family methyltransferase